MDWPTVTVVHAPRARHALKAEERSSELPFWSRFSVPLPEGEYAPDSPLALESESGESIPLQTSALCKWQDGSARWLDCQANLQMPGEYCLVPVSENKPVTGAATIACNGNDVTISNNHLSLVLAKDGDSPVKSIAYNNRERSGGNFLNAEVALSEGRTFRVANMNSWELDLVEDGPVRAVAEVTGKHGNKEGEDAFSLRLRFEVYAGLPVLVVRYMFTNDVPGSLHQQIEGMKLAVNFNNLAGSKKHLWQKRYSMLSISRDVETEHPIDIRSEIDNPRLRVNDTACLEDENEYPYFMQAPLDDTDAYIGLPLGGCSAGVMVDDFREMAPKGLRSTDNGIELDIWPKWAGKLDLTQGWSREMTLRIVFSENETPSYTDMSTIAGDTVDKGLSTVPAAWVAARDEFFSASLLPYGTHSPRRFNKFLKKLATIPTVAGMWDLGDTIDPGYTGTYSALGRLTRKADDWVTPRFIVAGKGGMRLAPWSTPEQFEPVWVNNEYDLLLALGREVLRGGNDPVMRVGSNPDIWVRLRWFARHAIEVDFLSYSDYKEAHQGSPAHSEKHSSASAYPSHLWCEGLLLYYVLTGDHDALDCAIKQGDFIIRTFTDAGRKKKLWHFSRELGWALMFMATVGDISGEERFLDMAVEIGDCLASEEITPELADTANIYSFGFASITMGLELLHRIRPRQKYADWIVELARGVAESARERATAVCSYMTFNHYNAAYAIDGNREHLIAGMRTLEEILDSGSWHSPQLYGKPVAMSYRGLSRFLKYADDAGLLAELDYRF